MVPIKKPKRKLLGIYLIIFGVIFLVKLIFHEYFSIIHALLVFFLFLSIDLTWRAFKKQKMRIYIIPGITLFFTSIFFLIYLTFLNDSYYTLKKLWPILGIFPGVGLIIYYFWVHKKNLSIIVPGVFISLLSLVLLLINIGILQFDLKFFLLLLVPCFVILIGLYLLLGEELNSSNSTEENDNYDGEDDDEEEDE